MFWVSVPVLSEQMQDVLPKVSTPALIDHDEGVRAARRRLDAISMNAYSLPRRDGPDVFQRLKFEQGTTHAIVRWTRVASTAYEGTPRHAL